MRTKTIVPKLGDPIHYLGKPVTDENGNRIGSIIDIKEVDDTFELFMEMDDEQIRRFKNEDFNRRTISEKRIY